MLAGRVLDAVLARRSPRRTRARALSRRAGRPRARRSARGGRAPRSRSSPRCRRTATGSTASIRSRRITSKPVDHPVVDEQPAPVAERMAVGLLHRVPVVARMCARNSGDSMWAARSRRLTSLQAGVTLRYRPGDRRRSRTSRARSRRRWWSPRPSAAWRLWSIKPWSVLKSSSSTTSGWPKYAFQRHTRATVRAQGVSAGHTQRVTGGGSAECQTRATPALWP